MRPGGKKTSLWIPNGADVHVVNHSPTPKQEYANYLIRGIWWFQCLLLFRIFCTEGLQSDVCSLVSVCVSRFPIRDESFTKTSKTNDRWISLTFCCFRQPYNQPQLIIGGGTLPVTSDFFALFPSPAKAVLVTFAQHCEWVLAMTSFCRIQYSVNRCPSSHGPGDLYQSSPHTRGSR